MAAASNYVYYANGNAASKEFLEDERITFHILETKKAAALYNKLIDDGVAVGVGAHVFGCQLVGLLDVDDWIGTA